MLATFKLALLTAFVLLVSNPRNLHAQTVVLSSKIGDLVISGDLVEFDGEFFKIDSDLGVLTVDGSTVNCAGEDCPEAAEFVSRFSILASQDLGRLLIPELLESFSILLDADIESQRTSEGTQTVRVFDSSGAKVAEIDNLVAAESLAFEQIIQKNHSLVAASREPNQKEVGLVQSAGLGNPLDPSQRQLLALDGIVSVVSRQNPVDSVTEKNLRGLLGGEISNWKDLGGPDAEIRVYATLDNEAFNVAVEMHSLTIATLNNLNIVDLKANLSAVADAVANDPLGIGLTSFSNIRNAKPLALRGECGIFSSPTDFSIKSGGYPLIYFHYLYKPKLRLPLFAREFLTFLTTQTAQNVVASLGFVDTGVSELAIGRQGERLVSAVSQANNDVPFAEVKGLMGLLSGAKRLSATFRFEPGSQTLDVPSKANAEQLALGLILGNFADKVVHLIGFSDSAGGAKQNKRLSQQRAETVRKAIIAAAPDGSLDSVTFETSGFGEASPLACDETEAGKQTNRRVEVWIKDRG